MRLKINVFAVIAVSLFFVISVNVKSASAIPEPVDVELAILIDVSGSVDGTEYGLQNGGYVDAFNSAAIHNAIADGDVGAIAVTVIYWAGPTQQSQDIPWRKIASAGDAQTLATDISNVAQQFFGATAPANAINFVAPQFASNDFTGTSLRIDVSGDGEENAGDSTTAARDAAELLGLTINGAPILSDDPNLDTWYEQNLITSDGFVLPSTQFTDFGENILTKIEAEIRGEDPTSVIPEPASMLLLGSGLWAMGRFKKKKEKVT